MVELHHNSIVYICKFHDTLCQISKKNTQLSQTLPHIFVISFLNPISIKCYINIWQSWLFITNNLELPASTYLPKLDIRPSGNLINIFCPFIYNFFHFYLMWNMPLDIFLNFHPNSTSEKGSIFFKSSFDLHYP